MFQRFFFILFFTSLVVKAHTQSKLLFNSDWEFVKDIDSSFSTNLLEKKGFINWEKISLPHTAHIEPVEKKVQQWQGTCFYRKFFYIGNSDKNKQVAFQLDAAMQEAVVYINGKPIYKHLGGYLPFYIDISDALKYGTENSIVIKLSNQDDSFIPPGKPIKDLDFNYYSGIYRNVWLIKKNRLHITNAVAANKQASGGILVHYENVSEREATLIVQTDIKNDLLIHTNAQIRSTLINGSGKIVAQSSTSNMLIDKLGSKSFSQKITINHPELWSPSQPNLYKLTVALLQDGTVSDMETLSVGIRSIKMDAAAIYVNGENIKIRGTNRHQEYPYVGNALSDNAQYRDAWKIKQAGFNFVRCSHYPPSPAFLDACDELGIMVMDAIPGWQFAGNQIFQENSFQNIKDMIRRDRNHPSIILWEASLNESGMKKDFMQKAHQIVHEELPFNNVYSAGWIDDVYDVFLPARQHAKAPDYWKKYNKEKPLLIAEYGDWEYYAQNAGFNQKEFKDLSSEERTSRQLRTAGEKGMLQQALNFQEAHNDNLYGKSIGDANWLMFDYKRGYANDIESSGIMDLFRLPKFSFYFYQSQVDPIINSSSPFNQPMLFIANYWQNTADTLVKVYSNCEEVELMLNGKSIAKQRPDQGLYSTNLKHPPFTFHLASFQPGILTAVGYINHKKVVLKQQKTASVASQIRMDMDESGKKLVAGYNDLVFVHATIADDKGTLISGAKNVVQFSVLGDGEIIGLTNVPAEAGIASIILKGGNKGGIIKVVAKSMGLKTSELILNLK